MIVKSLKNILMILSLWLVIGSLAGAALAATAENRIRLESSGRDVTLERTNTPPSQISSGNCFGSICSTHSFTTLSRLDGSAAAPVNRTFTPDGDGTLSISNGSPASPIALPNGADKITNVPSNLAFTFANANRQPQLHLTNATMTGGIPSPHLHGSAGGIGSLVRELFCSPPAREDCISENLFNSDPTSKSGTTGKVILAPEPTAAFLLGTGLLTIGLIRRRHKANRT